MDVSKGLRPDYEENPVTEVLCLKLGVVYHSQEGEFDLTSLYGGIFFTFQVRGLVVFVFWSLRLLESKGGLLELGLLLCLMIHQWVRKFRLLHLILRGPLHKIVE